MPTEEYALEAFANSIRQNTTDIRRNDIDGYDIGFAQSKSYWVDLGFPEYRWTQWGLPQIGIFKIGGYTEGDVSWNERWEGMMMRVDIFASESGQRSRLAGEIKRGFFTKDSRLSLVASGLKVDKLLSDVDSVEDEMLPQNVKVRTMTFGTYYSTTGA